MKKIIVFSILALGLIAASATAEIALVNSDTTSELISTTSATSLTLSSFNAGTAANTYLVVAVATKLKTDTANPVTSVTFGGTALTKIGEEFVDDTYEGWAILYGGALSGSGDVVVNYTAPTADDHDALAISVASYSYASGAGANSGVNDNGGPTSLTDSITTTQNSSLIVSCLMLGGPAASITGQGSTVVVQEYDAPEKIGGALLSLAAPTAGTYSPGADFSGQTRASMCSAELVGQAPIRGSSFFIH